MTTQTYELFVRTTPAALWQALTRPEATERYFFRSRVRSTFAPGAPIEYTQGPGAAVIVDGKVEEVVSERLLAHTWVVRYDPTLSGECSRVTWRIEARGEAVKLTVVHELPEAPLTARHVAVEGWSVVLCGLKTLLETGAQLVLSPPRGA
jgi:uncharacterized protein YndB with AHSA1/START domain